MMTKKGMEVVINNCFEKQRKTTKYQSGEPVPSWYIHQSGFE
jgi:hypothetical protein